MFHREFPLSPTQQATNGAVALFTEGRRLHDVRQQFVGLSVLRSATEDQLQEAITVVQRQQQLTRAEIDAMLSN